MDELNLPSQYNDERIKLFRKYFSELPMEHKKELLSSSTLMMSLVTSNEISNELYSVWSDYCQNKSKVFIQCLLPHKHLKDAQKFINKMKLLNLIEECHSWEILIWKEIDRIVLNEICHKHNNELLTKCVQTYYWVDLATHFNSLGTT